MNALTVFNFQENPLQAVLIDGEPWWVASDVCKILDLGNVSMAVSRLDDDEKGITDVDTPGGKQSLLCVNESGLYHLIFTSRKEEARAFRKWVTGEVLPSIRKTGAYAVVSPEPPAPEWLMAIDALQDDMEEVQRRLARLEHPSLQGKQARLPGKRRDGTRRNYHVNHDRVRLSHEQEKALVLEYVDRYWQRHKKPVTASRLSYCYLKRFSVPRMQQLLEELTTEGRLEHAITVHSRFSGGTFKPILLHILGA